MKFELLKLKSAADMSAKFNERCASALLIYFLLQAILFSGVNEQP